MTVTPGSAGDLVEVSVPASSANLGPGYDCLGLALELRDQVAVQVIEQGVEIRVSGSGRGEVPLDENHLVYKAIAHTFAHVGQTMPALRLDCENQIPHGRGLGSSAAAIVAGVCAARALLNDGATLMDDTACLQLAARLEGHPDNVAPALLGGFTVVAVKAGEVLATRAPLDPRVRALLFVPPDPVSTAHARSLLPSVVPHETAAANSANAALLVTALGSRPELLLAATEDHLHQQFREPAMPETMRLVRELRADMVPAVLSGAGPSVLAFTDLATERALARRAPGGWRTLCLPISQHGAVVRRGSAG